MKNIRNIKNKNEGFTLVELIVVLVILAILAAILVPALLGWIDRSRKSKDLLRAKACLTLVQAACSEQYALTGDTLQVGKDAENTIIGKENVKLKRTSNGDGVYYAVGNVNATEQPFAVKILNELDLKTGSDPNVDTDPYCIMFGVGSNMPKTTKGDYAEKSTKHDKYTVYYMLYMETSTSEPLFYYDGTWSTTNPYKAGYIDNNNLCKTGPMKGKYLQFYIVSNKTGKYPAGDKDYWNWYKQLGDD